MFVLPSPPQTGGVLPVNVALLLMFPHVRSVRSRCAHSLSSRGDEDTDEETDEDTAVGVLIVHEVDSSVMTGGKTNVNTVFVGGEQSAN